LLVNAIDKQVLPRKIVTRKSIENAIALVMATGGSTNAVLHYLAIAHTAGVKWTLDDFERVRRRCRCCATSSLRASTLAVDFHKAGGVRRF